MKQRDYKILVEKTRIALSKKIVEYMSNGWKVTGGVIIDNKDPNRIIYLQSMYLEEKD